MNTIEIKRKIYRNQINKGNSDKNDNNNNNNNNNNDRDNSNSKNKKQISNQNKGYKSEQYKKIKNKN